MKEYPKINSIYKRDEKTHKIIEGEFSTPEFEYLKDNNWVWYEKVDGMNIRVMWNKEKNVIVFGGKTDKAQIPTQLEVKLASLFDTTLKRRMFNNVFSESACLYGEGYGHKIQKGGKYIENDVSFILFDVKIGNWWLKREDVEDIASHLHIEIVPIVGYGTLSEAIEIVKWGYYSLVADLRQRPPTLAEGLVLRPSTDLMARNRNRIQTKIKYKDFN